MPPDSAMTGTFQTNLPSDLLSAVQRGAISQRNDLTIGSMKPSLMERVIGLFSKPGTAKPQARVAAKR